MSHCKYCGAEIPDKTGQAGRPRENCDNCRKWANAKKSLENYHRRKNGITPQTLEERVKERLVKSVNNGDLRPWYALLCVIFIDEYVREGGECQTQMFLL